VENPFYRRATEQLRDDEAFLSIVSPQPLTYLLKRPAEQGVLYDRLVLFRGAPGTGKTTLARLFEFSALRVVLRSTGSTDHEAVAGALEECGAIKDGLPVLLGCRLPMETDYRDFWEFPYAEGLKSGMLFSFIQARAVLAWFRHLQAAGVAESAVTVIARPDSGAGIETIGGTSGSAILERAREVERAVYEIIGALVAPNEASLLPSVTGTYRPFDLIDRIEVTTPSLNQGAALRLTPLVMLDDAHWLHPSQFEALRHWLARRELRIARWVLTRFDILQPSEALSIIADDQAERPSYPGLSASRDELTILLQSWGLRKDQRTAFRRMARDMAQRYLEKHSLLGPRRLVDMGSLLSEEPEQISPSKLAELAKHADSTQTRLKISDTRRAELEATVDEFRKGSTLAADIRLAMLVILMHRYVNRIKGQATLFGDDEPEPSRPLIANPGVYEAARLHLLHRYERPFYFGADDLCDASSENAELFLQLSAILVDTIATQVIRSKPPVLDSATQHRLLRERARRIIDAWSFPYFEKVRKLVASIATRCVETSLQPNGWLAPNAYGVLQSEFEVLANSNSELASILQFAVAYNAVLVVPQYECKNKEWCLLELGGPVCLAHGLTLKRGGFLEGTTADLASMLEETKR
jgi:hypothetical protein